MPDTTDLSSWSIPPTEEATTAAALFAIAEKLALSDEPGSTNMATEISKRADTLAKLKIKIRTDEYKSIKGAIDTATAKLRKNP
jgi:hypothetical protein